MSWAVSRHFTLRYSETLIIGTGLAPVAFRKKRGKLSCSITYMKRKCYKEPVVVTRQCICEVLGPSMCGVCALEQLEAQVRPPFSHI
eukprot:9027123-Pyramimonas_sp.AAC.1